MCSGVYHFGMVNQLLISHRASCHMPEWCRMGPSGQVNSSMMHVHVHAAHFAEQVDSANGHMVVLSSFDQASLAQSWHTLVNTTWPLLQRSGMHALQARMPPVGPVSKCCEIFQP